ncbi:MAG: zinc ribbon domain-containing protein [Deltaproteobacteria bacterium]|uniref:Zinc ribbon domain-containing protein n=1 Tax=Candidatus Zymogenus saltonus TaxID=2844893 RepID=A0A9D8PKU5_9DELT|nr:zinc ribbon domain-containing protein [Candidatus Zymogenus saltonus]
MVFRRIAWGIFLFFIGVFLFYLTFRGQFTLSQFLGGFRLPLLPLGLFFSVLGLVFYIDGRTIQKQRRMRDRDAHPRHTEHDRGHHDLTADEIPHESDLEVPKEKTCPNCKKRIYKDAKVCRFCGHEFAVTYILKVYGPKDRKKFKLLVKRLSERLGKPPDDIEHLLELGMRFRSPTEAKLEENRARFERFGCRVESYKKVARE